MQHWYSNDEAAAIIRRFVLNDPNTDTLNPYEWDDFWSDAHTNPDVHAAWAVLSVYESRFPSQRKHNFCGEEAFPYFIATANLLEHGLIHVKNISEVDFVNDEMPPKMKELLELVEDAVKGRHKVTVEGSGQTDKQRNENGACTAR